ncbi:flagellar protein FlaG [Crenobacter sp. SG2305]|uniref:flagellar protein FlaG n=1 Tax=Crenobacter oryzisoli TaxID=3056844 RepID=UPI0025AB2913|nr:flagellar protein FlaG [Crenobacter sp. SG2305]MDN0082647.1 flagellar protein FlaG [Crenobacter sp. SG2305]
MQTTFSPLVNVATQPVATRSTEQLPQFAGNQALAAVPDSSQAVGVVNNKDGGLAATLQNGEQKQPDAETLDQSLKQLNHTVSLFNSDLEFTTDEESGTHIVKVVNRGTKEVIRQIPSEEAVRLAQALDRLQGLLVRDKA